MSTVDLFGSGKPIKIHFNGLRSYQNTLYSEVTTHVFSF